MKKKKLYLSYTSIQTFLDCGMKFQLKYLEKKSNNESKANKYISFGNSIHRALADFNMITDKTFRTLDVLHNLLRKNWCREGYTSIEEEKKFGIRGLAMLTEYYNNPLDRGKKNLLIEEMIYKDIGDYVLYGKLDKVYVREDGIVEVLDFKTGNSVSPIGYLQLSIYLILTEARLGCFPRAVSFYYLPQNKKILKETDEAYIKESLEYVYHLCEVVCKEKSFEYNPTPYCKTTCEFYERCDAAKDSNLIVLNSLKQVAAIDLHEIVF